MLNKSRAIDLLLFVFFISAFSVNGQGIRYGANAVSGKYAMLNGVKHYYEVYGEGPPLLLIHGNRTGIEGWKPQIEYFSKKYQVFAIDCRGRGKSALGSDSLTYRQQAKDMAAFIKEMKLDSVVVIGKSDGGIVGILMGIYYPGHLQKIVSFSANMWPDSTALYNHVLIQQHKDRIFAEEKLRLRDTTDNWYLVQQRLRMMEFQPHISAADLHKIDIPVLVMSCDRDVIKEEHTFFIYKNIRRANLCIVPGERHGIPRENPQLFNMLIDKFLSEPFKDFSVRF